MKNENKIFKDCDTGFTSHFRLFKEAHVIKCNKKSNRKNLNKYVKILYIVVNTGEIFFKNISNKLIKTNIVLNNFMAVEFVNVLPNEVIAISEYPTKNLWFTLDGRHFAKLEFDHYYDYVNFSIRENDKIWVTYSLEKNGRTIIAEKELMFDITSDGKIQVNFAV